MEKSFRQLGARTTGRSMDSALRQRPRDVQHHQGGGGGWPGDKKRISGILRPEGPRTRFDDEPIRDPANRLRSWRSPASVWWPYKTDDNTAGLGSIFATACEDDSRCALPLHKRTIAGPADTTI